MVRREMGFASVLIVLSLVLPVAAAGEAPVCARRAGGDPPWPTYHGDDARTGNTSEPGPMTNNLLWSNSTGSYSYSSPALAGGKVYIPADDGGMYCFWAENGTRAWRTALSSPAWSGPAVDAARDRVFVCDGAALYGSGSRNIYCLNATTGSQVWKKSLPDYGESSPLIFGDTVIVGTGDSYVGGKNNNLYAFNFTSGNQVWATPSAGSCASPALYDGRLYSVGNGQLRCLDPATGGFFWNATVSHGYGSPSAADGRVFYPGADGQVYAFNASDGGGLWQKSTGQSESYSTCAISNGSLYVSGGRNPLNGGGGVVVKMDATDGSIGWSYAIAAPAGCWGAPAVSGGQVYFGYGSTVVCLNVSDKSQLWSHTGPAGTSQYGIGSSPSIAAGKLYIGASEAKLYCFGRGVPNEPPAAVKLEDPASVNETAMTLNWSKNADADFHRYELHMSKLPGFPISQLTMVQPDGNITDVNKVSLRVRNLEHTTNYYFRLRVWDKGVPPMQNDSNEVGARTHTPNGAPWAVKLFPAEDVTPFSMRLSWSVSNDSDFDRYEVHRGLLKTFVPTGSSLAATIRDADGNSTVVSGLKPWTTYFFKVRVLDNGTPVLYSDSNLLEVLTGNTAPFAVTLNQPRMGATSADLSWSASADDDFAAYEVHCSQDLGFTPANFTRAAAMPGKQTTDFSIAGLQLARTYHFIVRVVDQGGLSNDSNEVTGYTMNTLPKPVISSPSDGDVFDTRTPVGFDGSASSDQDLDPLSYHWLSSVDGHLSSNASFSGFLSEGNHRISLHVNDGHGHNVSARVTITVDKAPNRRPSVAVTAPADNAGVAGVAAFTGTAHDTDGNDTLRSVEVRIARGEWEAADGLGEWTFGWNTAKVANGKYKVLFRSYDGDLYSLEAALSVTVNNVFVNQRPSVAFNPPVSTRFSKTAVLTGTASDPDGTVSYVEVSVNGGPWQRAFGTGDWTYSLDTTALSNGKHSLRARAYDGTDYSDAQMLNFTASNGVATASSGPNLPLAGGVLAVVLVAAVVAFMALRRRKGPQQPAGGKAAGVSREAAPFPEQGQKQA